MPPIQLSGSLVHTFNSDRYTYTIPLFLLAILSLHTFNQTLSSNCIYHLLSLLIAFMLAIYSMLSRQIMAKKQAYYDLVINFLTISEFLIHSIVFTYIM